MIKSFLKFITSNKRNAVAAVLLLAVFLIIPVSIVHAQETVGNIIAGWALEGVSLLIYGVVVAPLTWILAGAGMLANYMMQPIQITTSNTVQMGWGITRDFANMFFILILLAIALDYILMGVSFGVKKALPTFIAVALLINFSLPIAGVFIDFSNIFTSFFLDQIGGQQFSETFANLIGIPQIFEAKTLNDASTQIKVTTANLTDIIFAVFFLIGNIFILLALSFMFLIRTGFLMGLLVVLPLVLVIMPFNRSYWGKWSGKFIQYVMFAPAATFFLYLSMKIFEGNVMSNINASLVGGVAGKQGFLDQIVQYLVIWFFMGGSLVAANSFGVHGSGAALKMFNQGENWVKGKIKGGAIGAGKAGAGAAGRAVGADKQMEKLASGLQKVLPGWAGGGFIASKIRGVASKTKTAMEKHEALTPAEEAKFKGLSNEALREEMGVYENSVLPGSDVKAQKIYEILMKRGGHIEMGDNGMPNTKKMKATAKKMYSIAKKHGNIDAMKAIRKANPTAYQEIAKQEWDEEQVKGNLVEVKNEAGETIKTINKNTGKTLEETQNRAFEEMTSIDFENLKGTWTKETVKNFVRSGAMSQGHLRMANINLDQHFMDYVGEALADKETMVALKAKSANFFNYLKSGGAYEYYGLKIPDEVLAEMGESKKEVTGGTSTLFDQFGRPIK